MKHRETPNTRIYRGRNLCREVSPAINPGVSRLPFPMNNWLLLAAWELRNVCSPADIADAASDTSLPPPSSELSAIFSEKSMMGGGTSRAFYSFAPILLQWVVPRRDSSLGMEGVSDVLERCPIILMLFSKAAASQPSTSASMPRTSSPHPQGERGSLLSFHWKEGRQSL